MKIIFILLVSFINFTNASEVNLKEEELIDHFVDHSWVGEKFIIKEFNKSKIDRCLFLKKIQSKYNNLTFVQQRMMLVLSLTKCDYKLKIVEDELKKDNEKLLLYTLKLANSLDRKSKKKIKNGIEKYKKSDNKLIKKEVSTFFKEKN